MDIKVTLNTRRIVILSVAFILFGLTVFLMGMVVGTKARPPEAPAQMAQAKSAGTSLADKIPPKVPELEKPSAESVAATLPDSLGKDKLPDIDAKKEAIEKLPIPEVDAKKTVADKIVPPEVDIKKEAAALVPPVLKDKAVPKTAEAPNPAEKDKKSAGKPEGKENAVEKKPVESKTDAKEKEPVVDESAKAPKPLGSYTVQVGAFLEKTNAEVMLQDLRKKGYTPYIHTIWDDMKRQWHTVRLGNYEDQEAATKSAADFTKKERMPTSVRGVGVL